MPTFPKKDIIPEDNVINKIYQIGSYQVMLDSDLAELYGIETKRLNEQVKRNSDRFPSDFMMQLTETEWQSLRSQIATSKNIQGGRKFLPYVFTEHGILMLSCILKSKQAIQINIQVIRIFIKLREELQETSSSKLEIQEIKNKLSNHDKSIELVFSYLDELAESRENPKPRKRIGYMPDEIT